MKEKTVVIFKAISIILSAALAVMSLYIFISGNVRGAHMVFAATMGCGVLPSIGWLEMHKKQSVALTGTAILYRAVVLVLFSAGVFTFGYKSFISPGVFLGRGFTFVLPALITVALPLGLSYKEHAYWWENMRKLLFFNRVVNPFDYEFLLTFDTKNEIYKYVGTLREIDKKRHFKWWLCLAAMPFISFCAALCLVFGLLAGIVSVALSYYMFALAMVYTYILYVYIWFVDIKSADKFFRKKK